MLGSLALVAKGPFDQRDVIVGSLEIAIGSIHVALACLGLVGRGRICAVLALSVGLMLVAPAPFLVLGIYELTPAGMYTHSLAAGVILLVFSCGVYAIMLCTLLCCGGIAACVMLIEDVCNWV